MAVRDAVKNATEQRFLLAVLRLEEAVQTLTDRLNNINGGYENALTAYVLDGTEDMQAVREPPLKIALALHLIHIKFIPMKIVAASGLLTQQKLSALKSWSKDYTKAYIYAHGLSNEFINGLPEEEMKRLMPNYSLLSDYIFETFVAKYDET